ncbi:MAG: hypothetical protein H0T98_06505, partial [Euzebyaceae bacterium]|nr:hypothetical protein [Euzebyaceae bacterium]
LDAGTAAGARAALACAATQASDGDWRALRLADIRARRALAGLPSDAAAGEQEECSYFRR